MKIFLIELQSIWAKMFHFQMHDTEESPKNSYISYLFKLKFLELNLNTNKLKKKKLLLELLSIF